VGSTDPILVALVVGILTLFGNMVVSVLNNRNTITQEKLKAESDLDLEKQKARYNLILQSLATNDPAVAKRNIDFFIGSGLLDDPDNAIRGALSRYSPVLPSAGAGASPAMRAVQPSDIAELYNFPPDLDGTGQIVGMIEFGGGFRPAEISAYFASTHQRLPEVVEITVGGAKNTPGADGASAQVAADIELVGSIAPKAQLRVYFAPFGVAGWTAAIGRAVADRVGILLVNWGMPESAWKRDELEAVNEALGAAAQRGVTIITAVGDQGVAPTPRRRREVMFPAASPWVLAVGGTAMESTAAGVGSEVVWNEPKAGATGGGVSRLIERPDWQAAVELPLGGAKGFAGRAIPDVSASAWRTMTMIGVGGVQTPVGGTTIATGVWAGLVARINQGLGRNVGHITPRLYEAIGPAGVLRPITKGDNSWNGVKGYSATDGWSPAAGWGVPDGTKLLEWLKVNG
jgi:kumamolisin